jgi:hypothetical protein
VAYLGSVTLAAPLPSRVIKICESKQSANRQVGAVVNFSLKMSSAKIPVDFYAANEAGEPYGLIWSLEDVMRLRRDYRVMTNPIGTLPSPCMQNKFLGIPFLLSHPDLTRLLNQGKRRIYILVIFRRD